MRTVLRLARHNALETPKAIKPNRTTQKNGPHVETAVREGHFDLFPRMTEEPERLDRRTSWRYALLYSRKTWWRGGVVGATLRAPSIETWCNLQADTIYGTSSKAHTGEAQNKSNKCPGSVFTPAATSGRHTARRAGWRSSVLNTRQNGWRMASARGVATSGATSSRLWQPWCEGGALC